MKKSKQEVKNRKVYRVTIAGITPNEDGILEDTLDWTSYNIVALDTEDAIARIKSQMMPGDYIQEVKMIAVLDKI